MKPMDEALRTKNHILTQHRNGIIDVFAAILALDKASQLNTHDRKISGVVYTPESIAMDMCTLASPLLQDNILEPSCGRGVFVFALAEFHLKSHDVSKVCLTMAQHVCACDIDPSAIEDLGALWIDYWTLKGIAHPPPLRAVSQDSLFGSLSSESFDLALGNPPYVRFQHLPEDYRTQLQKHFSTCSTGNVDLFFAFTERALSQATRTCFIFPNSWMSSRSGQQLRALLAPRVIKLADFGDQLVFAPVRAYVCILLASKAPRAANQPLQIQLGGLNLLSPWTKIQLPDHRIVPSRWTLSSKITACHAGQTLGDIATLYSGIATLADAQYALLNATVIQQQVQFFDPILSKTLTFPLEFAPPKIKLTKVQNESDMLSWTERILFPYTSEAALVPFEELELKYPDIAAFLNSRKAKLALRDRGNQHDYPQWHAYGRKQGLKSLPQGQLCAVPTMSQGAIQCFSFDAAKTERFLFTSGFVLAPKPGYTAADLITALAHPSSWQWALSHGKPWAGSDGKVYRSYGARLLLSMPLPP